MWGWDAIRRVARKIGRIVRPAKNKSSTPDRVGQVRHVFWACAGELSREIAWRFAPGCIGSTLVYKSLKGGQVHKIQSGGSSSAEVKEKRERMSRLEQEISSLKEERREWQMERLMLMASILALATGASLRPPRN